ncbi:MAG: helix-turn-helix transcriptional regulator [Rhodospirillales bacterium]|nr:helix-turn-helix transcriptional regulator [Rhodospirillales bacterium]
MSQNRQNLPSGHPGDLEDPGRPIVALASDHPGPHRFPPHRHLRAQLVYAIEGVMSVATATGTWVVAPQQAVWVPAGIVHEVRAAGPLAMRTLYVHPEAAGGLPASCCVVRVPPLLRELILRAVALPDDVPSGGPAARLLALIPDELRALEPEPLYLPLPRDRRLTAVTERLAAAPADGRPLGAWAREVGASERTLARLFLKETGLTFGSWRQRLRLVTAVARLAEGQAVTTVALDLGYDSPSAFIAMFRRVLGTTPGRYVKPVSEKG